MAFFLLCRCLLADQVQTVLQKLFIGVFSCFCFRWKGENVATSEVADILTMVHCILEANVYGVKVEGKRTRVINIKTLQSCLHFAFHISLIFQSRS